MVEYPNAHPSDTTRSLRSVNPAEQTLLPFPEIHAETSWQEDDNRALVRGDADFERFPRIFDSTSEFGKPIRSQEAPLLSLP